MATAIAQSAPGIPPAPVGIIRNGSARKAYETSERAAERKLIVGCWTCLTMLNSVLCTFPLQNSV